jgi:adenosine deaminase
MIELHCHLGGGVPAPVLWEVLQDEGMSTPFKTFDELQASLTPDPGAVTCLDDFLGSFFNTTELIQSSPRAMEASCYHLVAKAYRRSRTKLGQLRGIEVRFNPAKRIREGALNPDRIMEAAVRGLTRASSHYGVNTGIICTMGRDMPMEQNRLVVDTAIRWKDAGVNRCTGYYGVVGIDIAGTERYNKEHNLPWMGDMAKLYQQAREAGLGTTYHVGETDATGHLGVRNVIEQIRPDRIGHGIRVLQDPTSLGVLIDSGICLEICPSINLLTRATTREALGDILRSLYYKGVPFTICTDNPYLAHTNMAREAELANDLAGIPVSGWSIDCAREHTFLQAFYCDGPAALARPSRY